MANTLVRWLPRQLRVGHRASRSLTKINTRWLQIENLERRDQPSGGFRPRPDPCPPPPPPSPCNPSCLDTSVSGKVYFDKNSNGVLDGNDSGIGGVIITLTGTDIFGRAVSLETRTGADGSYSFNGVKPGTYVITETQPNGFLDGAENLGNLGGTIVANDKMQVTIGLGDISTGARNYNFAELKKERDCPPPPPPPCPPRPCPPRPCPPKPCKDKFSHGRGKKCDNDKSGHGRGKKCHNDKSSHGRGKSNGQPGLPKWLRGKGKCN